jgi:hypothetical protein
MSTRLEKVIQQASTLPAEIQDEIAEQWLEDIENELRACQQITCTSFM